MIKAVHRIGLFLLASISLFGADNVLTPQEKAQGWILLFDGKTLAGWDAADPAAAGRGQSKSAAQAGKSPGTSPQVGSNPRPCSSPAPASGGSSHWEVVGGLL